MGRVGQQRTSVEDELTVSAAAAARARAAGDGQAAATEAAFAPQPAAPRLTVLSGPSGVGKTTVVRRLREDAPQVWLSVSATTRHPRPGEIDGVHYHFVTGEQFDALVAAGELLEWAEFAGNRYGTPRQPVLERLSEGTPVLLEIEIQGARQVRERMPEAHLVFLAPPSWDELVRRLVGRGTEPPEVQERRLTQAREELAAAEEFDEVIVNSSVEDVCSRLLALMGIRPVN